jgi:hypothetical protein
LCLPLAIVKRESVKSEGKIKEKMPLNKKKKHGASP